MMVPVQDVLPQVPEAELFTLLIEGTGNLRVLDRLNVKTGDFYDDFLYGKKFL
jgi:hypothetical protein